jgi:undecaprenyl-diphosphatase
MSSNLLLRLDARDRALLTRWAIGDAPSRTVVLAWLAVTHLGGVACSIVIAIMPFFLDGLPDSIGFDAMRTLLFSHLVVQLVKRTVTRPRPAHVRSGTGLIKAPDRFSFPSGHAAAAMSVAFAYSVAYPTLAAPLLMLAITVGMSRVTLGVHYPGDVAVGQLLALLTGAIIISV